MTKNKTNAVKKIQKSFGKISFLASAYDLENTNWTSTKESVNFLLNIILTI